MEVLHVDDDRALAEVTAKQLEHRSDAIEVTTLTDSTAALEVLAERPIDCVVSDYEMPGMDGLELLDAVRDEHPDLPFILFTGAGSEGIASEAITAGVTEYLRKRTSTEQYEILAHRIEQAVERARTERALRNERELLANAVDVLRDVFYVLDADGELERWNDRANEVTGYTDEEIAEMNLADFFPEEMATRVPETIGEVIETGGGTLRAPILTKAGDRRLLEFRCARLTDDDGEVRGVCGIAREIGARENGNVEEPCSATPGSTSSHRDTVENAAGERSVDPASDDGR